MVRALVEVKRGSTHRAVLGLFVFLDFGLVFQVGLARTKTDSLNLCFSEADFLPRSATSLLLAMCARLKRRHDAFAYGGEKNLRHYSRRMPEL